MIYVSQAEGAQLGVWFSNGNRDLATSLNEVALELEEFTITPNPFNNQLTVSFQTETAKTLDIKVSNLLGQQLYSDTEKAIQGVNQFQLNLPDLQVGTYILSFTSEKGILSRKIIKN